MTRKQALFMALEAITDEKVKEVIQDMINDFPWHEWTETAIFDAVDQFVLENGRPPTPTDFKYNDMLPQGATVQYRMGITLSEFLKKYYPKKTDSHIYYNKTKEEWLLIFKETYQKLNPKSANEYNKLRPKDTPTWLILPICSAYQNGTNY